MALMSSGPRLRSSLSNGSKSTRSSPTGRPVTDYAARSLPELQSDGGPGRGVVLFDLAETLHRSTPKTFTKAAS